ncbi:MAG TPA: inorganic phosphate transporter, partial [Thermoanaerobaculia bacterium]|nr:inorganic phosphate transporter [Thermoanaerobaculia bacterium]
MSWLFLSSGLFLGWSLGANDAANLFGTAVGTKMVRFATAALVASVFVVLGAVSGGAGAAGTLGRLGAVDTLPAAFAVAFAAALSVFLLLKRIGLPVSTSQAIVGAIVGWNLFTGRPTDARTLLQILASWFLCPLLAAGVAAALFLGARAAFPHVKIHLLEVDAWTRAGLLAVGAFGAFSLGQNNIANVMGVFVRVSPFPEAASLGPLRATGVEMLFFLGGLSIATGIYTYSHRVMRRVGEGLTSLSPLAALIVVLAASIVLFLFASPHLERALRSAGLPALPLVPVSSSQAVVGAILGISLVRGSPVKPRPLAQILLGWAAAPLLAMGISFLGLVLLQNVFRLPVTAG